MALSAAERYLKLKEDVVRLGKGRATLLVVSKQVPLQSIQAVYKAGCRDFGESRMQELIPKIEALPDAHWHLIGTLQLNKVRKVIGRCVLIHSVDSLELAQRISQVSLERNIKTNILLQVNTSGERSKHGYDAERWLSEMEKVVKLPMVEVKGFMTMAPFIDDKECVRDCFKKLRLFRDEQQRRLGQTFPELSMGMSNDYRIALEEGATWVRIGSAIWEAETQTID